MNYPLTLKIYIKQLSVGDTQQKVVSNAKLHEESVELSSSLNGATVKKLLSY
jgi:hypothetical protein